MYNRREAVEKRLTPKMEKAAMFFYKKAMLNRNLLDTGSTESKNKFLKRFGKKTWGPRREMIELKESFNQQWKKKNIN